MVCFAGKARLLRARNQHPVLPVAPDADDDQAHRPTPCGVRDGWRRVGSATIQAGCQGSADVPGLVRRGRSSRGAGYFDLLPLRLPGQAEINQVQAQRREQHIRKAFGDLTRLVAGPDGGERRKGDQIPHGAVKGSGFVGDFFHRSRPSQPTPVPFCPARSRSSRRNSSGGT